MTKDIQVRIIDDPSRQDCDADCGTDWSSEESLELARNQVKDRFKGKIRITYLDISGDGTGEYTDEWKEKIERENLSIPLLVLNDRLRISGNFDIRQMLDTIEAELEMGV